MVAGGQDFFEYMYLGFWMTCAGSYLDLVPDSKGCRTVPRSR